MAQENIEYVSVWPPPSSHPPINNDSDATADIKNDENLSQFKEKIKLRALLKRSNNEVEDTIITAETLLASWWRNQLRSSKISRLSNDEIGALEDSISKIECSRAKLNAIKRHPSAKSFLEMEAKKLETEMNLSPKNQYLLSTILFTMASLPGSEEKLLEDAQIHLSKCISKVINCDHENLQKLSHQEYLNRVDSFNDFQKEVLSFSYKLELQMQSQNSIKLLNYAIFQTHKFLDKEETRGEALPLKSKESPETITDVTKSHQSKVIKRKEVDRIHVHELSVDTFLNEYCRKRRPLVITGLNEEDIVSQPWTLDHISEIAGDHIVTLKKPNKDSIKWAKLEPSTKMTVAEFISKVKTKSSDKNYLFDWSLPLFCPKLNSEITIPKYFEHDYLKNTSSDALYRQSWPSLFISEKGSLSELHVDAFGSNFWMYLFQGRKRWTFFPPELTNSLQPNYFESLDPVFDIDLSDQEVTEKINEHASEVILEEGELLFVPYGSPHRVENLKDSVAISANFVDDSNIKCVTNHLRKNCLQDPRAGDLLQEFIDIDLI